MISVVLSMLFSFFEETVSSLHILMSWMNSCQVCLINQVHGNVYFSQTSLSTTAKILLMEKKNTTLHCISFARFAHNADVTLKHIPVALWFSSYFAMHKTVTFKASGALSWQPRGQLRRCYHGYSLALWSTSSRQALPKPHWTICTWPLDKFWPEPVDQTAD